MVLSWSRILNAAAHRPFNRFPPRTRLAIFSFQNLLVRNTTFGVGNVRELQPRRAGATRAAHRLSKREKCSSIANRILSYKRLKTNSTISDRNFYEMLKIYIAFILVCHRKLICNRTVTSRKLRDS